jgi:hypothetical protein
MNMVSALPMAVARSAAAPSDRPLARNALAIAVASLLSRVWGLARIGTEIGAKTDRPTRTMADFAGVPSQGNLDVGQRCDFR